MNRENEREDLMKNMSNPAKNTVKSKRTLYTVFGFVLLFILLDILIYVNLNVGSVSIGRKEIQEILFGTTANPVAFSIIRQIRLPRLLAAALLGGALSVSGFLLQTFFHNPIAGPFVLGISSGAKLTVALLMIAAMGRGIVLGSVSMIIAAFIGAMLSMGLILAISGRVHNMAMLVICGVMIGYICSAITDFVVTFADDANIVNLHNWSLGSFSGITWANLRVMGIVIFVAMILTFLLAKPMGAYQLGEGYAANLGVNVSRFRVELILLSSILSATVTAFAGPISFVGIAVPHLVKSLFRTAKPVIVIPAAFLGGADFCLFCDLLARTVFAPTELSISTVTAIFGAPVVIYMMIAKQNHKHGRG